MAIKRRKQMYGSHPRRSSPLLRSELCVCVYGLCRWTCGVSDWVSQLIFLAQLEFFELTAKVCILIFVDSCSNIHQTVWAEFYGRSSAVARRSLHYLKTLNLKGRSRTLARPAWQLPCLMYEKEHNIEEEMIETFSNTLMSPAEN